MSERRRSLFVLLIVVALIGGAIAVVATKPTKLGLDLQGGAQLVYKAEPTAQQPTVDADAMQRVIDLMQQRVNEFGVSEAEVFQSGQDQIEVNVPGVSDAGRIADQVGSTAQLFFYDWEANILNEDCETEPDQNSAQRQPVNGLHAAVTQAAKCTSVGVGKGLDPIAEDSPGGESQAAAEPRFYVFDKNTKKPLAGGQSFDSEEAALDSLSDAEKANAEVIEVPAGVLVLREQRAEPDDPKPDRWWIIQDRPGLSGTDIKSPGAELRPDRRQPADRQLQLHRRRPRGVPGDHAARRPARRRQLVQPETRTRPRSTSRSRSTTSWSPHRRSTGASTRTGSTAGPAPRSPAASRSSPRRTSRRSSRSARCR